jgi:hypothetical protein
MLPGPIEIVLFASAQNPYIQYLHVSPFQTIPLSLLVILSDLTAEGFNFPLDNSNQKYSRIAHRNTSPLRANSTLDCPDQYI